MYRAGWGDINPYIKGKSCLSVEIATTPSYGSEVTTYKTNANGTTYTDASFVTDALKIVGEMTITSTVTDERGRSGSDTKTINVLDYTAPVVTALSVHRCNVDGTENEQGEYVKATFSASVTPLGGLNSASYAIELRKTTEEESKPTTLPISDYSVTDYEYIFRAETESSYYVKVYAIDNFDSKHGTMSTTVSTARTLLDFYGDRAIGLGKVCEIDEGVEVGLPMYIREGCAMNAHYGTENQYDLIERVDELTDATGAITVSGTAGSSVELASGTVTKIELTQICASSDTKGVFSIVSGDVQVNASGVYMIAGSVYMSATSTNPNAGKGVYIRDGNDKELVSAIDFFNITASTTSGAVATAPKLILLNAGEKLRLCGRALSSSGTAYTGNVSTYLTVLKVG